MTFSRRNFLQISGLTLGGLRLLPRNGPLSQDGSVSIIVDPADRVSSEAPCVWAIQELMHALQERRIKVAQFTSLPQAAPDSLCIVASGSEQYHPANLRGQADSRLSNGPELSALLPLRDKRHGIVACGDLRGLMYALLELADRVRHSEHPFSAFEQRQANVEGPANSFRSVGRIFCSDVQDKPWFYDREMWPAYFSMLATQRFNRFSLNLGIGYDFLDSVSDAYFLFAYPFLISVPGYKVRAVGLPDQERDRNLEMLQFISAQAVAHGIDFQLGIWTHGYHWESASQPNYIIEGITAENHAAYSRDALTALLKACPNISGITLRTHGESGVREGSYAFWKTVFSALPASGRKVNLDLHTKGLDQQLIDAAVQTGMSVTLSPKFWAEHMGLPYHQSAIRELEMPHEEQNAQGFFSLSSGSRSFTRYGYADFLREDRAYKIMFRIWPGSHRLLLWGDPSSAAAYARAFQFCGSNGVELFEPLSFKGRRASGIAGSRCAYSDTSLVPHWDWQKYLYTYRTWGRLMYNPEAQPNVWRRYLQNQFGAGAPDLEAALGSASCITPLITTAHLPSAANEVFNPEYYTNQSMFDASKPTPYFDTPMPKLFGNVSPLDPQLFSTINEFVGELLKKESSAKYSPIEVAEWLDAAADSADSNLTQAEAHATDKTSPEFRRAVVDIKLQIGVGRFFAAKFRSGVLYAAFEQSGARNALEEAITQYQRARDIWRSFAETAKGIYVSDITFGPSAFQRGNWLGRLPAIDEDIAEMQKRLETLPTNGAESSIPLHDLTKPRKRESVDVQHTPAANFVPGQPLEIAVSVPQNATQATALRFYYRHVNQAERYQSTDMVASDNRFSAAIPASYTNSNYPLQYYFELRRSRENAWLFPGLVGNLQNQPYFVVHPVSRF